MNRFKNEMMAGEDDRRKRYEKLELEAQEMITDLEDEKAQKKARE